MRSSEISASLVCKPFPNAARIRCWVSGVRTARPKRSESRRKSSAEASAIALTRSLTATWPAAGKPGDPVSERPDEAFELGGGQRPVDPAVPLGELGVVILRAQHHFHRSRTTHQAGEVLNGTAAR